MSDDGRLGPIIDGLGVTYEPEPGDLIADVVVLLKVVEPDGSVGMHVSFSESLSWIERVGMLRLAERAELDDQGGDE